ncbi:hypothetical protein [Thalassobacillus pellis]|uniref:hypothetical protein n=1 Tax=Thalassobacillus pellis TaxID=748008 RepID=UPI00196203D6|nr:hypothetical protein [Thalassobacillus pellis]MBM7553129.1 hypothetical protein [Thalassobacillus pellis]
MARMTVYGRKFPISVSPGVVKNVSRGVIKFVKIGVDHIGRLEYNEIDQGGLMLVPWRKGELPSRRNLKI